jgi:hypothetical protein
MWDGGQCGRTYFRPCEQIFLNCVTNVSDPLIFLRNTEASCAAMLAYVPRNKSLRNLNVARASRRWALAPAV